MTWRSVPQNLVTLRTMLASVTEWTAAGGAEAQIHYPYAAPTDNTFPRLVLFSDVRNDDVATNTTLARGTISMQLDAFGRYGDAITGVDTGAGTITVAGDISGQVTVGDEVRIQGSTGNDLWYLVTAIAVAGDTTLTLSDGQSQGPQDATVDGTLFTGSVEDLADQIVVGLLGIPTGLPLRDGGREGPALWPGADDPDELQVATATITISTGLDAS